MAIYHFLLNVSILLIHCIPTAFRGSIVWHRTHRTVKLSGNAYNATAFICIGNIQEILLLYDPIQLDKCPQKAQFSCKNFQVFLTSIDTQLNTALVKVRVIQHTSLDSTRVSTQVKLSSASALHFPSLGRLCKAVLKDLTYILICCTLKSD